MQKAWGVYRKPQDQSTTFASSCRSAFGETTTTLPNQSTTAASRVQNASICLPSVIMCQVTDYNGELLVISIV